jgi:hypothetical protein
MSVLRCGDRQSGQREGRRINLLALRRVRRDVESESHADRAAPLETVGPPMNTIWIVGGVAAIFAIVVLLRSWQRRSGPEDLGAVSHQWVTEHRLGNDSRR